jgi:hypothetical protein
LSVVEIDLLTLIGQYAFPIAVSTFLLWERQKSFKENNDNWNRIYQESLSRNNLIIEVVRANTVAQTSLQATIQKLCEIVNGKAV